MRYRRRQHTNSPIFFLLFGVIFAAAGVLCGAFFGQTSTLDCQRLESNLVDCRLQRDLLDMPLSDRHVGHLEAASVDVSTDSEGGATYRVVLQGPSGQTPLTSFYSSSLRAKEETADAINRFLADPAETTLQIEQFEWWVFILTGVFVFVGLLAMAWGVLRLVLGLLRR